MSSNLKSLLAGKTLILRSLDGGGNKVHYTGEEKDLCAMILTALFGAAEIEVPKPVKPTEELLEILAEVQEEGQDLPTWARAGYRTYTGRAIEAKLEGFPKMRDPTSIQLLFRSACEKIGLEKLKDSVFPRYGEKKKQA